MSAIRDTIVEFIFYALGYFDWAIEQVSDVLTLNIFNGGLVILAQGIANVIKPIAYTIISICFLIEFIKITAEMNILKWEYGVRVLIKFVFAKVAIDLSSELLTAIYTTGADLIITIGNDPNGALGNAVSGAIEAEVNNMSWMQAMGIMTTIVLPIMAIMVIALIVLVMAYARIFELSIYIAIAPIPCAFLPVDGSRITKKFFFSFAAVVLQGVFMVIILQLYKTLCITVFIPLIVVPGIINTAPMNMLFGSLLLVLTIMKSGTWAKQILDSV